MSDAGAVAWLVGLAVVSLFGWVGSRFTGDYPAIGAIPGAIVGFGVFLLGVHLLGGPW